MDWSIPVFEVSGLCYTYDGRFPALDHIHLTVRPGERLVILGSNGSGKTTLLKILDGLYFPSSGTVKAFGQELSPQALQADRFGFEFRSRVGFVFQDSDVQLFMPTVWEEVAFAPLQLGLEKKEVVRRVEDALHALRIEELRDRSPYQLSAGEKKRVALASVLSLSPEVWLLDEPSAGLDPRSVSWLKRFMAAQGNMGKTIILATHDLELIETMMGRVCVLGENHRILAEGSPSEVLSDRTLLIRANLIGV